MTRIVLVLLFAVVVAPSTPAGPPERPSGRTVLDDVAGLRVEVQRLEREAASGKPDLSAAEQLALARARLATAEGRTEAARRQWRKVIDSREERMAGFEAMFARGLCCNPAEQVFYRGAVAEARCGLAEVERDRAALARELPHVIAYQGELLKRLDALRRLGVDQPEEVVEVKKAMLRARTQLDAVTQGRK